MAGYPGVIVTPVDESVVKVTFSRPPNNYLELTPVPALADAYDAVAAQPLTRVIVLTAEGKHFCAGGDFSRIRADGSEATAGNDDVETAVDPAQPAEGPEGGAGDAPPRFGEDVYAEGARLMAAPLPVVAVVQGAAVGGGLGLACTADFRVGSPQTRLAPNFSQIGIHHGFGLTVTLPRIIGAQRAMEVLLTGRRISGEDGYRLGLLDRLVTSDQLETAAIAFAREIASAAPRSIRAIRQTMRLGLVEAFREAAARESQQQAILSITDDFREGVRAYAERRPPRFTGH